ncbi:hypothetical protein Fmac_020854 [Flemingia macrophylla]|uniref:14-3-3 domain-containing protein n=1 Tax=Flemingia macrophylla TaxID=520843 RepID=A0ABD1LV80_9FABA
MTLPIVDLNRKSEEENGREAGEQRAYVYLAKLSEQAERYDEMVEFMQKVVAGWTLAELTVEEWNLLSVAYKNMIGSLRAAWRIVSSIEQKEEGRKNEEHVSLVKEYRSKVEKELSQVCASILNLLDSHHVPSAAASESKVFYLKMKGDYHRYLAEFKVRDQKKIVAEDTMLSYKAAQVNSLDCNGVVEKLQGGSLYLKVKAYQGFLWLSKLLGWRGRARPKKMKSLRGVFERKLKNYIQSPS